MQKIIVIGCPGSGKSTFARSLRDATQIPLYYLDMMYWNTDKTTVDKSVFLGRLSEVIAQEKWIIDGNYASTMEYRITACDTVFFLDYPTEVCLRGIGERRGKTRDDMPWIETEEDTELTELVKGFSEQGRVQILALLEKYSDKKIYRFTSREEADVFLRRMT